MDTAGYTVKPSLAFAPLASFRLRSPDGENLGLWDSAESARAHAESLVNQERGWRIRETYFCWQVIDPLGRVSSQFLTSERAQLEVGRQILKDKILDLVCQCHDALDGASLTSEYVLTVLSEVRVMLETLPTGDTMSTPVQAEPSPNQC